MTPITLSAQEMASVGTKAIQLLRADSHAGRPLTARYGKYKSEHGGAAVRDLHFSGRMMAALTTNATSNSVELTFKTEVDKIKAAVNEKLSPWFHASPSDHNQIRQAIDDLIRKKL